MNIQPHQIQTCPHCKTEYSGHHRCQKPFDWRDVKKASPASQAIQTAQTPRPKPKTQPQSQPDAAVNEIRAIHKPFIAWLRSKGLPFLSHRSDTRSGIERGAADFAIFWQGRVLFIECKTPKGKLSDYQANWKAKMEQAGCEVWICRSLAECQATVNVWRNPSIL